MIHLRRIVVRGLLALLAVGIFYGLFWAYDTYWKPAPAVVQQQNAALDSSIAALLEGLPAATPDLAAFPVTVENCGRTLSFAAPPQRVIGMWQPSNELLLALGLQDRVIGFAGMYDRLPVEFATAAADVPKLGSPLTLYLPNREQMLTARPDLVVTEGLDSFAFDAAQGFATVDEVQQMGAQIYSSGSICDFAVTSNRGIEAVYNDLVTLGAIFGVSARAEALVVRLQAREAAVIAAVAGEPPVRVAYFNGDASAISVMNSAIWSDLLRKAGGANVFEGQDTRGKLSPEAFAAIDADVILYGIYPSNGPFPGRDPEQIAAYLRTTFPNIPAVRNGRLYPVPNIITESSVRAIDGLELIARDLHPQVFAEKE